MTSRSRNHSRLSGGSLVSIPTFSSSSITQKRAYAPPSVVSTDDATCGTPMWMEKGFACVCFKPKGSYRRMCINLTPSQASVDCILKYKAICMIIDRRRDDLGNFNSYVSMMPALNLQEARLKRLKHRMKVNYEPSRSEHREALRALWYAAFPRKELHDLVSEQWKEMGWQGRDPSTDFRGAGFISLENLLFFAKTFSTSFHNLLKKQGGKRATWEYPFAVAGVNITFMIMQMLELHSTKPASLARSVFIQMLSENEWAFDLLYCVAFVVMDKQWLQRNATYMEFNDVLKYTRSQLEKELIMEDVLRIEDMPSYSFLC
uniref:ELMO domain-containing protein n=1 Tax=Daucus carota subsp. sativus TaxID=79200 RepID=A0A175YK58_DAUCS